MSLMTKQFAATGRARRRTGASLAVALVALVVLAVLAVAVVRDQLRDREWAHGGDAVNVRAHIEATDASGFGVALREAGVPAEPAPTVAGRDLVVRVTWSGPPTSGGHYAFVLLDDRVTPAKPVRANAVWQPDGDGEGPHWAGAYAALSSHYPWLVGTAPRQRPEGWTDSGEALGVRATRSGEATVAYWLEKDAVPTTRPGTDLLLAIFLVDADGEVRWARKVPLSD